jgi:hypothetical protein
LLPCLGGGIGRRAGFKIQFFRECGFDSHPRYKRLHINVKPFFILHLKYFEI